MVDQRGGLTKVYIFFNLLSFLMMDSLPKQTLNPNKHLKEQFVSNLDGSSILEIAALLTIVPLLVLLRYSIDFHWKIDYNNGGNAVSSKKNDDEIVVYRNWKAYTNAISLDFIFIVFPMLLFFTVLSEWVYLGAVLLSLLLLILSVTAKRSSSGLQRGPSLSFRASVSSYRVALMLITCLCILAVDFTIFPRRYAKTETYGTSLMDLGVGSFVLANAIVSRQARDVSSGNWITGLKGTAPLLLLAFIRLVTTSGVDYQVHVTEYGVHWNFFFTLAAISILTSFVNIPAKYCGILGFSVLAGYQTWLISGLNTYLLSDERGTDIISKNKEGVYSILGYWGMYLLGVHLGYRLFYAKHSNIRSTTSSIARVFLVSLLLWIVTILLDNYVERISRRTCNMPYVTWVLAQDLQALGIFMLSSYIPMNKLSSLEEAIDQNLLATFLLANLVTGMVNLTVDTIFASPFSSLLILTAYAFALSAIIGTIHFSGSRLKFW
ncbi:Phosphatidylinositol anchor biosynthesis protein PIGW/GWT1 [Arabidopsis thaliana x Arabidopsis arenosa]|uniref:Phosphatidylinositol anchor biosynthesis protein PIGW/GWT1 n=2 Tax=Arabidopsis thaliana x Arabidopsis arenosa TaxID=1240361 RepID=A0A8T1Y5Z9_9BRAS|nr:Phosphatidylinositol anchor biosynthesis protein PIGW/GWT1 [Arabidopsis thaliana x Arabidopsis arenosa]